MAASQIDGIDEDGDTVPLASELIGGKQHPARYSYDGHDETQGAKADAAATTDTGTFSLIALFKRLLSKFVAEDAAHVSGDVGIQMLGVRKDTAVALGADGDYMPPIFDSTGRLHVSSGGDVAAGGADSGNPVKTGGVYNSAISALTDGWRNHFRLDSRGNLRAQIVAAIYTGADGILNNALSAPTYPSLHTAAGPIATAEHVFNGTSWDRSVKPNGSSRIPSAAADTNPTNAKNGPGNVHIVSGYNAAASVRYLKFYNKASAPTVGTDTPVITLALPATAAFNINLGGHYFATGISYGMTTGAADNNTGALTAADVLGLTITYA